jgi:large subunit ribosomal protein L19
MNIIDVVEKESMKEKVPQFKIGDLVDVHVKTIEGDKERIQIFNGMVIKRKGSGPRETFTVRRVVQGEGVERIFPVHSPNVADVKVKKSHKTRRAKLYFLRDRKGKGARLKEIRRKEKKTSSVKKKAPAVVAEEPAETTKPAKPKKAAKAPKAKAKATKKKDEK